MAYRGAGLLIACKVADGWEVLLGKRKIKPFFGYWSIPGGGRETKDSCFLDTACRETKEEICHDQRLEEYLRPWLAEDFDRSQMPEHTLLTPYLSEWHTFLLALSGRVPPKRFSVPNYEFSAIDWFPVKRLQNPTHPGVALSAHHFDRAALALLPIGAPLATLRMAGILARERLLGEGPDRERGVTISTTGGLARAALRLVFQNSRRFNMKPIPNHKARPFCRQTKSVIVQADDSEVGQLVAVHAFKYSKEPGAFHGIAVRIKATNLPFVIAQPMMDVNHPPVTPDVRFLYLMKVTEGVC